jgi:hypothetical protein
MIVSDLIPLLIADGSVAQWLAPIGGKQLAGLRTPAPHLASERWCLDGVLLKIIPLLIPFANRIPICWGILLMSGQ